MFWITGLRAFGLGGYRVLGLGVMVLGFGLRIWVLGQGFGFWV